MPARAKPAKRPMTPEIHMPGGRTLSWKEIKENYRQQLSGQSPTTGKMRRGLATKLAFYNNLAEAVSMRKAGRAYSDISKYLGVPKATIIGWLERGYFPRAISPKKHEMAQKSRRKLIIDPSKQYELGYALGIFSSGVRLQKGKTTGRTVFNITSSNREIVHEAARSIKGAFGLTRRY